MSSETIKVEHEEGLNIADLSLNAIELKKKMKFSKQTNYFEKYKQFNSFLINRNR